MMKRMAMKAPAATTAVALTANSTLKPSFIVLRSKTASAGGNAEAVLRVPQAGGDLKQSGDVYTSFGARPQDTA